MAKFLTVGAQISATVVAGVLIGHLTDQYMQYEKPFFTLIFGLLFSLIAIYQFIKQYTR